MPRSRKRGRRAASAAREAGAVAGARDAGTRQAPQRREPAAPSRSERRDAEARARLEPLAPGERPGAVTVAALAAAGLGVLNVVLYLAGVRVQHTTFAGTVGVGALLLLAAYGMWRARYWAVLGFEVLLAITCIVAALSLLVASSVAGAVRALLVMGASGTLFWKLVRAMARIQMPQRRSS
jgi:hypothetical protein